MIGIPATQVLSLPLLVALTVAIQDPEQHPSGQGARAISSDVDRDDYAPHVEEASDEAERSIARFEVAEGLDVRLFASEPMLANPVCFYVDDRGDVYVAETFRHHAGVTDMREHMGWLNEDLAAVAVEDRVAMFARHDEIAKYGSEHDRVRLIRDLDDDGAADMALVFADGFNEPAAGIGAGLLSYRGTVYFTCIPHLWALRDEDGNGRAEVKEAMSSGYGIHVALLGHDLHGLRIGPDGRLYFSCGDRGFSVQTQEGETLHHPRRGAVLRCELDGSNLEIFCTGLRNPQELVFDEYGNLFTGENNSDGGDRARWTYLVQGSDSGWRYFYQWLNQPLRRGPWNDEKLWHPHHEGQAAYIVPPIANLADGPSGLTYHPGTSALGGYERHFFLCDFRGDAGYSGIHAFDLKPKGASFELGEVERLWWNILVTDCDFGPDGELYASDWIHGWNKTGKGRLYRASASDGAAHAAYAAAGTERYLAEGMGERAYEELASLLRHADRRVRQEAQFELVRRNEAGAEVLEEAARGGAMTLERLHGIWGLGMLHRGGRSATSVLGELLTDTNPEVRAQAAREVGDLRDASHAAHLIRLLGDGSTRVRFFAAQALGRMGPRPEAVEPLFDLARSIGSEDPTLRHAVIQGLLECATPERLLAAADDASVDARVCAVVALRHLAHPGLADFLTDSSPLVSVEAARAIHDLPIASALPALADQVEALGQGIEHLDSNAWSRRVLNATQRLGGEERARALVRFIAKESGVDRHREEALGMLRDWRHPSPRDLVIGQYRPVVDPEGEGREDGFIPGLALELHEGGILDAPLRVSRAWIDLVAAYPTAPGYGALAAAALDGGRPQDLRARALEVIGKDAPRVPAGFADHLPGLLLDPAPKVRAAALGALQSLDPEAALPALRSGLGRSIEERRAAYAGLALLASEAADAVLAEELQRLIAGLVPAEVALDLTLAAESRKSDEIVALLDRHRAPRAQDELLGGWIDVLYGGDAERGKGIFHDRAELSCLRCHKTSAESDGGAVGPDLTGLSERMPRIQVLESILDPNRNVADGYQGTVFFLHDGTILEGRILSETEGAIRIIDKDAETHEIPVEDIEVRRQGLSAMPTGLGDNLDPREMRDLIEYLSGL